MGGRSSGSNMNSGPARLRAIEDRIRDNPVETAALMGSNGEILFDKSDNLVGEVRFSDEEVSKMVDGTLTHNHPSGTTFSPEDIDLAYSRGLRTIRAVHSGGSYELTRNFNIGDETPQRYAGFSRDYERSVRRYMRNTVDAVYASTGDAARCNSMVAEFRKQWLRDNSSKYGWIYKEVSR